MKQSEDQEPPEELSGSHDWSRLVGSQREDQYTPMGEIEMGGDFAMGVARGRRTTGWKRWVGWVITLTIFVFLVVAAVSIASDL